MNYFVSAFETVYINYKLGVLSHVELLNEIHLIDEYMRQCGYDAITRIDALEEGEKRAKKYYSNR